MTEPMQGAKDDIEGGSGPVRPVPEIKIEAEDREGEGGKGKMAVPAPRPATYSPIEPAGE